MGQWIQLRDADMNEGYYGGWCLSYVQDAFHTDHPYSSAIDSWNANYGNGNHAGEVPPLGITVPVYFSLGNVPAGHVAIRLDDGYVASSTLGPLNSFHAKPYYHPSLDNLIGIYGPPNGGCNFLGWSEYVGYTKVVGYQDTHTEEVHTAIPFDTITKEDETLAKGQTATTQAGVDGDNVKVYQVTTLDGAEQSRAVISDNTTSPVPQINLIGTYVEPEAPVEPTEPTTPVDPSQPTTPTDPVVPVPPKTKENNIVRILVKIVQAILNWFRS